MRGTVTTEEFREAVRDAGVQGIDDAVWKLKLLDSSSPATLSNEDLLHYLGGGSPSRLSRATISEADFLVAVTDAFTADYEDRLKHVEGLWKTCVRQKGTKGTLNFTDFGSVMKSEEPTMPATMTRSLFLTAVEMSRACTQLNGDPCIPSGTLDEIRNEYGGDVVTFKLFAMAALKCGLFLKDFAGMSNSTVQNAQDVARVLPEAGRARANTAGSYTSRGNQGSSSRRGNRR
jgi:hypothetical protein